MNSPIILALLACITTIIIYVNAGKISNKWLKGSLQIASIFIGFFVAGAIASDATDFAKVGEYFFYIMIAIAIVNKLFGKKK